MLKTGRHLASVLPVSRSARIKHNAVIMPSPARLNSGMMMCPDCSPPRLAPSRKQLFQYILVADVSANQLIPGAKCHLQSDIAHNRCDDCVVFQLPLRAKVVREDPKRGIAIDEVALFVDEK